MHVVYSDSHLLHTPETELHRGEVVPSFENPTRVDYILQRLKEVGFPECQTPPECDLTSVQQVHTPDYLAFLETAWAEWQKAGLKGSVVPGNFPARRMSTRRPRYIDGLVGYYALANETTITSGTWAAALSACASAQEAQRLVAQGARSAFALCRPPGHHASRDQFGGYCFLNNAAVAAQQFRNSGAERVAILDIDFHHGNGTQDIFYERADVLVASLHGQPEEAFPYFSGYADERGKGLGLGATANFPLPPGTDYAAWAEALDAALVQIEAFGAEALVVSLGVDTFKEDPISLFQLESEDYLRCGARLGQLKRPTVWVMEGGYAVDAIGVNVVNVLQGFEES